MAFASAMRSVGPEILGEEKKGVKMFFYALVLCKFGSLKCRWGRLSLLITSSWLQDWWMGCKKSPANVQRGTGDKGRWNDLLGVFGWPLGWWLHQIMQNMEVPHYGSLYVVEER